MLYLEDSLFPRIRLHRVGAAQQVVYADTVKVGQRTQQVIGQRLCPGLHIAIFALCDADGVRHLLLCHVVVIPQILDAVLHANNSVAR